MRAFIADHYLMHGDLDIFLIEDGAPGVTWLWRPGGVLEEHREGSISVHTTEPSLRLPARALEAIVEESARSGLAVRALDTHVLKAFEQERGRVDRLLDTVSRIAVGSG